MCQLQIAGERQELTRGQIRPVNTLEDKMLSDLVDTSSPKTKFGICQ